MREERCPAPTEEGARNYATVLRYENRQPLAVFKVRLCDCTMELDERFDARELVERHVIDGAHPHGYGEGRRTDAVLPSRQR